MLGGRVTVFQRNIDAINIKGLEEVILRDMRHNTTRGVANEPRRQDVLALGEREAPQTRCKRACSLQESEF